MPRALIVATPVCFVLFACGSHGMNKAGEGNGYGAACAANPDCAYGEVCVDAACISVCASDLECGGSHICTASGVCSDGARAACVADTECSAGDVCAGGLCMPASSAGCITDADCGGDICVGGACMAAGAGCASDADCGAGESCVANYCVPGGNTSISFGGAQDFGYFRRLLEDGLVPASEDFGAAGFFAEHHTPLPMPVCGERICLQTMLGVMGNLLDGAHATMMQIGLNSPLSAANLERPPLTLALVVDVSGSMSGAGKIDFVKQGLHKMVDELLDEDQLTLIAYDTDVSIRCPMAPVAGNREALHTQVGLLSGGGSTNFYGGLESGYQEVFDNYDSGRQHRVIMLSDGQPTAGNTDESAIMAMSQAYNADGVGLTTVGLGTSFNYNLMSSLALTGDGNFYFLEDASAVDEVFTEELAYFTMPVAFDIELDVTLGGDYVFGRALGTPFWEDTADGSGGHLAIPSVFLAHRVAHDDVTGEGSERRGGGSMLLVEVFPADVVQDGPEAWVATVSLSFREPGTDAIITETLEVTYPYAADELVTTGFFENEIVTKSFVVLNIFEALEAACDLYHAGSPNQAVTLLNRVIAAATDYEDSANNGEGNVDIQLDVELLQQLIAVMQLYGAGDPDPSGIPDDPWPGD